MDPSSGEKKAKGRIARYRRGLEERLVTALFEETRDKAALAPGRDLAATAAIAVAVVVHLVTLAMFVGGVWILVASWRNPFAWLPALALLGTSIMMRPRFPRLEHDAVLLCREDEPRMYALVDRVSDELGGPRLQVFVSSSFNASAGRYGLRQWPVLEIGLPLWNILDPQERIHLLGHEIGHFVNNDGRRGLIVGTAWGAATQFYHLLTGHVRWDDELAFFSAVSRAVLRLIALGPRFVAIVLGLLTLRAGQRAEYLADQLGARVASSQAVMRGLQALLLERPAMNAIETAVRRQVKPDDLWQIEREAYAAVPPMERERQLRLAARRDSRIDETHPPTHLRIKLAQARPQLPAAIVLGRVESELIDKELAPAYSTVAHAMKEELLRNMYL